MNPGVAAPVANSIVVDRRLDMWRRQKRGRFTNLATIRAAFGRNL
jgi:hypothetical protein